MDSRPARRSLLTRRRRALLLVGVLATTVVAATMIASFVPFVPHNFSGSVVEYGCPSGTNCTLPAEVPSLHSFPTGSSVQFHWISVNAVVATFHVSDSDGSPLMQCSAQGLAGTCGFTSDGGSYEFNFDWSGNLSSATLTFAGTFSAPLL